MMVIPQHECHTGLLESPHVPLDQVSYTFQSQPYRLTELTRSETEWPKSLEHPKLSNTHPWFATIGNSPSATYKQIQVHMRLGQSSRRGNVTACQLITEGWQLPNATSLATFDIAQLPKCHVHKPFGWLGELPDRNKKLFVHLENKQ